MTIKTNVTTAYTIENRVQRLLLTLNAAFRSLQFLDNSLTTFRILSLVFSSKVNYNLDIECEGKGKGRGA